ncbi:hypothetical protein ElyMa_004741800 [Elysia marginata]|uniref:Uncharacterized protein n=1 Tax=Elysia marginata TaxID=1093978 RepID=A0AAV4IFM0_9GAST|nr:hypothetical protein ElyMa_004741800 [Elysia marginata]
MAVLIVKRSRIEALAGPHNAGPDKDMGNRVVLGLVGRCPTGNKPQEGTQGQRCYPSTSSPQYFKPQAISQTGTIPASAVKHDRMDPKEPRARKATKRSQLSKGNKLEEILNRPSSRIGEFMRGLLPEKKDSNNGRSMRIKEKPRGSGVENIKSK